MLTTLLLTALLSDPPVPAPPAPPAQPAAAPIRAVLGGAAAADLAPRIVELKPDADGKVKITVMRPRALAILGNRPGGAGAPAQMVPMPEQVELGDVKDLKVTTAGGKEISKDDALKMLAKGGVVVVSADGKSLPPAMLKLFREEVLVLASPELTRVGAGNLVLQGIWPAPGAAPRVPANPPPQQ